MAKKTRVKKKRVRLAFDEGLIFVHSSFNNTIISLLTGLETSSPGLLAARSETKVPAKALPLQLRLLPVKLPKPDRKWVSPKSE